MSFHLKRITKEQANYIGIVVFAILSALLTFHASPANAKIALFNYIFKAPALMEQVQQVGAVANETQVEFELPKRPETIKTMHVAATAYTSRPRETDASPFITADGSVVRDGIIATNILPFGTKIRIPALYGDKIFEVHDRMNARYGYRIDVWMDNVKAMNQFGMKRNVAIEIVEMGDGSKQWDQWKGRGADLYQIGKHGPAANPLPQPYIELASNQ